MVWRGGLVLRRGRIVRSGGAWLVGLACACAGPFARAEGGRCSPECGPGAYCNPNGYCASACGPECGPDEACVGAECVPAKFFWHWHFVAAGGPVFQTFWSDGTTSALGLGAAGHFEVGDAHRLFLGPRFAVELAEWSPPPCRGACGQGSGTPVAIGQAVGIDVGYRARFGGGAVRVGPVAWLEPELSSFGPYLGGKGGVALEQGRLFLALAGGGGAFFVSGVPAPSFSLAVEVGGVAF